MTLASSSPPVSLVDRVLAMKAGAHVTGAAFLAGIPAVALGDGTILVGFVEPRRVMAHPEGAVLVAIRQGARIVTGGDDGRVVAVDGQGNIEEIAHEVGGWIDALSAREDGTLAWASGRHVRMRTAKGEIRTVQAPSSARGLSFAPKGVRLAFAHYNGVSLWYPNTDGAPESLHWKGSHLDASFSPDGRFLVSTMQENALHGWRLADGQHMRMQGYPAKSRSLSWSHDGNWLATSGAEACIIWPFDGKTGPMGKSPRECGVRPARVSQVSFHPRTLVVALGYEDGMVLLCRLADAAEILVRKPLAGEADAVSALCWDGSGQRLIIGTRGGAACLLTMPD